MIVMGCAMTFMVGMTANAMFFYKGVQVNPRKRESIMVTWGDSENETRVSQMLDFFGIEKYAPEGMGVDHEKWLREKEEFEKKTA